MNPDSVTGVTWVQLGHGSQPTDVTAAAAQTIASIPIEKTPALTVPANDVKDFPRVILMPLVAYRLETIRFSIQDYQKMLLR